MVTPSIWRPLACIAILLGTASAARAEGPPAWAFPVNPPVVDPPDDPPGDAERMHHLPDSDASFSSGELDDLLGAPDWYSGDHPPAPSMVVHGTEPNLYACGYCHLPTGFGRPENASLAGLPAAYIIRQVQAFQSGTRASSVPSRVPVKLMVELAGSAAQNPDLAQVARYFASIKLNPTITVVEAASIPKTEVAGWVLTRAEAGGTEPIGERVVEMPDDFTRFEERDARLTYTAFVPPGSLKRGEDLVRTGGHGKTMACDACHGLELRGQGSAPPLAGRSPSYMARQLYDMQSGARHDAGAAPMKLVVAKLTNADLVAITAYLASLQP